MRRYLLIFILIFLLPSFLTQAQNAEGPFQDIPPTSRFFFPLSILKELKIIEPSPDNTFQPLKKIKQGEAFEMILKTATALKKEAPQGTSTQEQTLPYGRRRRKVSLAQALRLLFTYTQTNTWATKDDQSTQDLAYAVSRSLVMQQENGETFPLQKKLTRGEMVLLLYRFLKIHEHATFGYASWYSDGLAKTKLKNNIEYAEKFLTAAHQTLSFGTVVRVTNMHNGNSVEVVINDRGPFVTGRIIDLSKTAFSALENPGRGIIPVQLEVVSTSL